MKQVIFLSLIVSIFICISIDKNYYRIKTLEQKIHNIEQQKEPEYIKVILTAYTLREKECNEDLENTALMMKPIPGYSCAVSVDLKHLLGKKIYVYGYGVWYVNDLMNKRHKKSIDLLVFNVKTAEKIGRQKDIEIVTIDKF